MATSEDVMRILAGRRQRTGRIVVAAGALASDVALALYVGAGLWGAWVLGFTPPPRDIPLTILVGLLGGALAIGAATSVWLCSQFRGFRFVMTVEFAWLIVWLAALWRTLSPEPSGWIVLFLCWHIGAVAALWSGRRAFHPTPG